MLTEDQLAAVFATKESRKRKPATKGTVFVRGGEDSLLTSQGIAKMGDYDFGAHAGKVGSMRRSRKGQSRRQPNGRRYYVSHDYDRGKPEVVAYLIKPR